MCQLVYFIIAYFALPAQDYKVGISVPKGMTLDQWADKVSEIITAQEEAKRKQEEEEQRIKNEKRDAKKRVAQVSANAWALYPGFAN